MDPIQTPPETISAAFPNERAARSIARALEEVGISPEQISIAHRGSAVLSAANEPATIRATGEPADSERDRSLAEPGFYVHSQRERQGAGDSVLVIVAPEVGQEDLVNRVLSGKRIERLHPQPGEREFSPGNVAPTPEVLPNERIGNQPDLWWNVRQRARFLPTWAKAGVLLGGCIALVLGGAAFAQHRRKRIAAQDRIDWAA